MQKLGTIFCYVFEFIKIDFKLDFHDASAFVGEYIYVTDKRIWVLKTSYIENNLSQRQYFWPIGVYSAILGRDNESFL